MNTIKVKFADSVLVPIEGITGSEPGPYETMDGKVCSAEFISGWNNKDGRYDKELDDICQSRWNLPFSYIKSLWMERVKHIEGYWHLLNLKLDV